MTPPDAHAHLKRLYEQRAQRDTTTDSATVYAGDTVDEHGGEREDVVATDGEDRQSEETENATRNG